MHKYTDQLYCVGVGGTATWPDDHLGALATVLGATLAALIGTSPLALIKGLDL